MNLSPTQQRIMDVLSDGRPHTRAELVACLNDEMCCRQNLGVHLFNLRLKLRAVGQDILCVNSRTCYRHIRKLADY